MEVVVVVVSMFETNCYLVYSSRSLDGVIIDPGDEPDRIDRRVKQLKMRPMAILLTHGHVDHIGAVNDLMRSYSIPLYAGRGEEKLLQSAEWNMSSATGAAVICPAPDRLVGDGDQISVGEEKLTILETPGHSPGGICYAGDGFVFCGDTLFFGSIGRTDFPGCSHRQLIDSITRKLLLLSDDTRCYPGHGPVTTIGHERRHNPFLTGEGLE